MWRSLSCASAIVMRLECIFVRRLAWLLLFLLLHFASLRTSVAAEATGHAYAKGCAHLRCESGGQCIKRRFWCKNPPCPGMLYCSRTRTESLKGPDTCDTVQCSAGHTCVVKVRGCRWDEKCEQQIARCVSEKEYHEGAASCAGFECPAGKRCILRESHCISPPCKLLRSCAEAKDVRIWFDECRKLDCPSEYECFLRRPDNNCTDSSCVHAPDCTLTAEDELIGKQCRGWICPRTQKCAARIVGVCKGFDCAVERSCRGSSSDEPILTTTTRQRSTRYVASSQTEIAITRQRITTESCPITESPSSGPYFTLPYPPAWLNYNRLLPTDTIGSGRKAADEENVPVLISAAFPDRSENSSFPTADGEIARPASGEITERSEVLKPIYVASDVLPLRTEGINFVGQGYPIWIKNELHRSAPLGIIQDNQKDDGGWKYHRAPQEPYRILLPPYEPVILVEDTKRGRLLPFFVYAFDRSSNEATLISPPAIVSNDATRDTKIDGTSTTADDRIDDRINGSSSTEIGNYSVNHFGDSSGDYENTMGKTNQVSSNIRDKKLNNPDDYEWRPWLMIHDYLAKSKPVHKQDSETNADESATDDLYTNGTLVNAEASVERRIKPDENTERISETRYARRYNKRLGTFGSPSRAPIATGQRDDVSADEEHHYDFVDYPYGTIIVRDVDQSRVRDYQRRLPSSETSRITPNEGTQRMGISMTAFAVRENEQRPKITPDTTSPYGIDDGDDDRKDDDDDPEYYEYYSDEYYSGEEYYDGGVSGIDDDDDDGVL